jgi:ribosomal protein L35AE/L33A
VKLEKMLFGMYSPHKVKLAVSGCPRNCAEAGIKDVGVIGVESGYEIYVAGNGGIKTEVAQYFCKVSDDDEVMEYSGAFLQLYREEGWYLERTVHYIDRVGLDYVKGKVVADAGKPQGAVRTPAVRAAGLQGPVAGDWIRVCALDEIAPQGSRVVASSQGDIAIFRTAADQVFGLHDKCPHKGGPPVAGHRARQRGDLSAARHEDRPQGRRSRGAGQGLRQNVCRQAGRRGCVAATHVVAAPFTVLAAPTPYVKGSSQIDAVWIKPSLFFQRNSA